MPITSFGGGAVANVSIKEGTTSVGPLTADEPIAFWTVDTLNPAGPDGGWFDADVVFADQLLNFLDPHFVASPDDADGDNVYKVVITATTADFSHTYRQQVNVRVLAMTLTDNLVEVWKLNEASGNAIGAFAAINFTPSFTGVAGPTSTTGKVYPLARLFSAANGQIFTHANAAALQTGDIDFTIAGWVKLSSKAFNAPVMAKDDGGGGTGREYLILYDKTSDRFLFAVFTAGATAITATANNHGSPVVGNWVYITATHNAATDTASIQVDTTVAQGVPNTMATGGALQVAGVTTPEIGGANWGGLMDGVINQLGFWKRVLTPAEITQLWNGGAGLPFDSWVATPRRQPGLLGLGLGPL